MLLRAQIKQRAIALFGIEAEKLARNDNRYERQDREQYKLPLPCDIQKKCQSADNPRRNTKPHQEYTWCDDIKNEEQPAQYEPVPRAKP